MRKASILRTFFAALFGCGILILHSTAWAQSPPCPDSTGPAPNPSVVPWTYDSAYVQVNGTLCYMEMYFCDRELLSGDSIQAFLEGVYMDSTTGCDSTDDSTLILSARAQLDTIIGGLFGNILEPCFKNSYVVAEVFSPTCWTPTSIAGVGVGSHNGVELSSCSPVGGYCEEVCQVCYNPASRQAQFSNCHVTGPAEDLLCVANAPWNPGGCYWADCFDQEYSIQLNLGV